MIDTLIAFVMGVLALYGIHFAGKKSGEAKIKNYINKSKVQYNEKLEKIRSDTSKLSDAELDAKLSKIYDNK